MPAKVGEFRRGRVEGNGGCREVGGSNFEALLELVACGENRDCQPWKDSPEGPV